MLGRARAASMHEDERCLSRFKGRSGENRAVSKCSPAMRPSSWLALGSLSGPEEHQAMPAFGSNIQTQKGGVQQEVW